MTRQETARTGSTVQGTSRRPLRPGQATTTCRTCHEEFTTGTLAAPVGATLCGPCTSHLQQQASFLRGVAHYVANLADTADELLAGVHTTNQAFDLAGWVAQQGEELGQLYRSIDTNQVEAR